MYGWNIFQLYQTWGFVVIAHAIKSDVCEIIIATQNYLGWALASPSYDWGEP